LVARHSIARNTGAVRSAGATVELESMLCFALYSAHRRVGQVYRGILAPLDLSYTQYLVLIALTDGREVTVGRLGGLLGLDSGTLSPLLKRLERRGLVLRRRDAADERTVQVCLTEQGRAVSGQVAGVQQEFRDCMPLDQEEARDLLGRLHALIDRLADAEPDDGAAPEPLTTPGWGPADRSREDLS